MKSLTILPLADTPNLIVREIESYDVKAFSGFMMQPRYQRYTAMRLRSDAEVAAFVLRSVARQGDDRRNVFHLAAEERSSGEAIGDGFLIMQRDRTIEIGWGVHPAMWSCGIGTEIGRALLGPQLRAPDGEKRVVQDHAGKFASAKLASRIGMVHENRVAGYAVGDGRFEDVDIYAMTAAEYFDLPY